jgi:regulator of RNase E activity RraA
MEDNKETTSAPVQAKEKEVTEREKEKQAIHDTIQTNIAHMKSMMGDLIYRDKKGVTRSDDAKMEQIIEIQNVNLKWIQKLMDMEESARAS